MKPQITRDNYEQYMLDYLAHTLDAATNQALRDFLQANPDLAAQAEGLEQIRLTPPDIKFLNKQWIKDIAKTQTPPIEAELEKLESDERFRLRPNPNIIYPHKLSLKYQHQSRLRPTLYYAASIASLLIIGVLFYWTKGDNNHINNIISQINSTNDLNKGIESIVNQIVDTQKISTQYAYAAPANDKPKKSNANSPKPAKKQPKTTKQEGKTTIQSPEPQNQAQVESISSRNELVMNTLQPIQAQIPIASIEVQPIDEMELNNMMVNNSLIASNEPNGSNNRVLKAIGQHIKTKSMIAFRGIIGLFGLKLEEDENEKPRIMLNDRMMLLAEHLQKQPKINKTNHD